MPSQLPATAPIHMGRQCHEAPASNQGASKDKRDDLGPQAVTEGPEVLARHWMQKARPVPGSSSTTHAHCAADDMAKSSSSSQGMTHHQRSLVPHQSAQTFIPCEEQGQEAGAPSRVQVVYVMNKARDLCARLRQESKAKAREERKKILLKRQITRDVARQAAQAAREKETLESAFRKEQQEEQAVLAMLREREKAEQQHELAQLRVSEQHHARKILLKSFLPWGQRGALAGAARRWRAQAAEAHAYHEQSLVRSALWAWQVAVHDQKAARHRQLRLLDLLHAAEQRRVWTLCRQALGAWKAAAQETHARGQALARHLHALSLRRCLQRWRARAHQDHQLRTGILLWDRWMQHRAFLIWRVKAQHMTKLLLLAQEKKQAEKAAAAAAAAPPSLSLSLSWAMDAQKWLQKEVARVVAPPPAHRSPSYYLDEV